MSKQLVLAAFFLLFAVIAMRPVQKEEPVVAIQVQYHRDLDSLNAYLSQCVAELEAGKTRLQVQATFIKARLAYKKVAHFTDYLDPEYVKDYINGAPLPKLERNYSQVEVIAPKGYQPLEEALWDEVTSQNTEVATALARELQRNTFEFSRYQKSVQLDDRMVLEAIRFALIRLFTLDLTGFDSPASGNSMGEVKVAFTAMKNTAQKYAQLIQYKDPALFKRLNLAWEEGVKQLSNEPNFDNFDRLNFLKISVNPLFSDLLLLHESLGYPKSSVTQKQKVALNYEATNLFSPDFLNPFYYTQMVPSEYDSTLVSLGKLLFYDPVLSASNERACASCHQPEKGYTDGLAKSMATGMQGSVKRNAPTLLNAVYAPRFFWDMRTSLLETQFEHVLVSKDEFNSSVLEVVQKLEQSPSYVQMFKNRFPQFEKNPINPYTLNMALSAFVISLKSHNSPVDRYIRGEIKQLPEEVKEGFNLFMGKAVCGTCHFAPTFSGIVPPLYQEQESEILGVPATAKPPFELDADLGRAAGLPKENSEIYQFSFKTVTVRNAALSSPYMHNGVYQTLEEVINFYHEGGGVGLGLDVPYQTLPFDSLSLNEKEKRALVAFMEALTDTAGLTARPISLPAFTDQTLNQRTIGGVY